MPTADGFFLFDFIAGKKGIDLRGRELVESRVYATTSPQEERQIVSYLRHGPRDSDVIDASDDGGLSVEVQELPCCALGDGARESKPHRHSSESAGLSIAPSEAKEGRNAASEGKLIIIGGEVQHDAECFFIGLGHLVKESRSVDWSAQMVMRQGVLERVLDVAVPYGTSAVFKELCYLEAEDRALDSAVENAEFVVQHRSFFIGGKGGVNWFGAALGAVVKFIVGKISQERANEFEGFGVVRR